MKQLIFPALLILAMIQKRFLILVKNTVRDLARRDDLNDEAKTERDAADARIKAAADAAATQRKR